MSADPKAVVQRFLDDAFDRETGEWNVDVVVEGDLVVHRVSWRTTHVGPMLGVAATGRPVEVHHVEMWRVDDGKIVEHWGGVGEAHHLYQQLTGGEGAS